MLKSGSDWGAAAGLAFRGSIKVALFPSELDLLSVSARARNIGDVEVMLRGDAALRRKEGGVIVRVDARHLQRRDFHIARISAG